MMSKLVFWGVFALCLINVNSLVIGKRSAEDSSEEKKKEVLESIKQFVELVDKYHLNVSIISSSRKYGSGGWVKEDLGVTMHMPHNQVFLTEATLDDSKQEKFLHKIEKLSKKEKVGAKSRDIKIGEVSGVNEDKVNEQYLIDSVNYKAITNSFIGKPGFVPQEDATSEILYDFRIKNDSEPIGNIQVITGNVKIDELEVSEGFPVDVLAETKKFLPKLWMAIDDDVLFAKLLAQHLDEKFEGDHQVMLGVEKFALGGKKFANLKVAEDNILVFVL